MDAKRLEEIQSANKNKKQETFTKKNNSKTNLQSKNQLYKNMENRLRDNVDGIKEIWKNYYEELLNTK